MTIWIRLRQFAEGEYQRTRWLVMTAAALAAFVGFQLFDHYFSGP
jgi:hypothetical protein